MERRASIDNIPEKYIDDPNFKSMLKTIYLGDAIGTEKIYVNIDFVKPGAKSSKYHAHSKQEEFFLIMSGSGILRMGGEKIPIKSGDFISKPAGRDIAHQFINNGTEILQILDIGTRENDDVATYPDENIIYMRNKRLVFNINNSCSEWDTDPNE